VTLPIAGPLQQLHPAVDEQARGRDADKKSDDPLEDLPRHDHDDDREDDLEDVFH
jgi:hypothetical protein